MAPLEGFLNLNKPAGWTSHDCVAKVRKILQMKRVGHGGTLDPAATGVLPIALGRATRLLQYLPTAKAYRAIIRFGVTTSTDDLDGDRLSSSACPSLTQANITCHLDQFIGTIQQIPPKYSAIQVNGKRLYDLARAGVDVEVPVRTVEIHNIEVLNWRSGDFPELEVAIACGPGTYIRSIARDLGTLTGAGATLANLIRTESHSFHLNNSLTLDQLATLTIKHQFVPIEPQQALPHLPQIILSPDQEKGWLNGRITTIELATHNNLRHPLPEFFIVCNHHSSFLGIGTPDFSAQDSPTAMMLKPKLVFN